MKERFLSLTLTLLLFGCATELTGEGRMVREIQADWSTKCKFLGVVDASEGNGYDIPDDRRGALNIIRNSVARMKGNAFVISDISNSEFRTLVQADAYKCPERK